MTYGELGCLVTRVIPDLTLSLRISELFEIIVDYEDKTHPLPVLQDLKVGMYALSSHVALTRGVGVSCEDGPAKRVGERFA